jgi:hypothetical protein
MCSSQDSSQEWDCSSTIGTSSASLASTLQVPETVVQYGLKLQSIEFPVFLAAGGVFFTLGVLSFLWLKMTSRAQSNQLDTEKSQRLPKRKARLLATTQGSLGISSVIALVAAYATTQTLSSLLLMTPTSPPAAVQVTRGTALEVLQWFIFSLSFLFYLGVSRLIRQTGLGQGQVQQVTQGAISFVPPPPIPASGFGLPPPLPPPAPVII